MKLLITAIVFTFTLGACGGEPGVKSSGHEYTNPSYYDPAGTMQWMWDSEMTEEQQALLCNDYLTVEESNVIQIIMDTYPADETAARELYKILNEECG